MVISILIIVAGFVLLIKGADWLVTGSSALAKKYNVSDLVIGLTIVSFGTSAPELVVNSVASFQQHSDIVFGNILGSNIVNLFLILGIAGLIYPITVHTNTVWKEIPVSVLAVVVLYFLSNGFLLQQNNVLTRFDGLILLAFFGAFLYYIYVQMKADRNDPEKLSIKKLAGWKIWLLIVGGLTGLILGGKLVVDNAVKIATELGISEKIIGLTIIAIGTSLPELMTSVVAAIKKNSDIAIGNIIGSNIFNIFLILSVSSIINPVDFNTSFNTELYLLGGGTLVLFIAMFTGGKQRLDRWESVILLVTYILYTVSLISREI
ncbi:MAG TPA: calcium/sodium antiporter [Draconibacterium sp.]|nr:calcium/sodium antiporter [Draconibacterium sp.]